MKAGWQELRINTQRMQEDFSALAAIGASGDGGVNRPTFSEAHLSARGWFLERAAAVGLETWVDGAGNHSAILRSRDPQARTLLLGSHLDSVVNGGAYDGALGVLAALETLRTVQEAGLDLPVHLEAIDFTDEEGTLFGLLGSAALSDHITTTHLQAPRGGREALLAGLEHAGLTEEGLLAARRDPASLAGYLELHIEQGGRLEQAGVAIGVVSAIVGIGSYLVTFNGRSNHAGTTSMAERRDASLGAAAFILETRRRVMAEFPDCVVNTGQARFWPGAYNIIPGRVELALEYRSPAIHQFTELEKVLLACARQAAEQFGLLVHCEQRGWHAPAPMSVRVQEAISQAAQDLGLPTLVLASGAGHDGQMLAAICPSGMIFIPSQGGISHAPQEFSHWEDCVNGANVLLQAALKLVVPVPPAELA